MAADPSPQEAAVQLLLALTALALYRVYYLGEHCWYKLMGGE